MTYEPGTVATATVRGVEGVRVLRTTPGGAPWWSAMPVGGKRLHNEADLTDVRPLVVLDLPDPSAARSWSEVIVNLRSPGAHLAAEWVADQIEAQTRPPKPAEPQGLGAVVKDREGALWIHNPMPGQPSWDRAGCLGSSAYADIDAVEVLSPGVAS